MLEEDERVNCCYQSTLRNVNNRDTEQDSNTSFLRWQKMFLVQIASEAFEKSIMVPSIDTCTILTFKPENTEIVDKMPHLW